MEIGVIFIIIHTYVGKTTGGYWQVLGGTENYACVEDHPSGKIGRESMPQHGPRTRPTTWAPDTSVLGPSQI